jgi:hypothetical protein
MAAMHGSKLPHQPYDSQQIDVSRPADIHFWTRSLGVSEKHLRDVVARIGSLTSDIRAELHRKREFNDSLRVLRVFVFYPSPNHPDWWVLSPGAVQQTFASEGAAVEFALGRANSLRGSGRPVEVVQEKITGTWMRVLG